MYEHLFQVGLSIPTMMSQEPQLIPMSGLASNVSATGFAEEASLRLKRQEYELKAGRMEEASDQFNPIFRKSPFDTSSNSSSLTNDYLMDQKLRNSGLYSKLKNKTIYSQSEFVRNHSGLNSGIL